MRGALLDRGQPLVVAQVRAHLALLREQLRGDLVGLLEQRRERGLVDGGIGAQRREHGLLPLELLHEVGLQVGARRDVGDLEQRQERGVMIGRGFLRGEEARAREEILEAHQRADALVQRVLVPYHGGAGAAEGRHSAASRGRSGLSSRAFRRE